MNPERTEHLTGRNPLILVVCTANICRSPFAANLLRRELSGIEEVSFNIESAGTEARGGDPACKGLWGSAGQQAPERGDHSSRVVTRDLADQADLILALSSSHSSSLAVTSPKARSITFKLAVASRLASQIVSPRHALASATGAMAQMDELDPLVRVPKLPQFGPDRFEWLVAEMDAWRGSIIESEADSVIDPHEAEDDRHPAVASEIIELVESFALAVKAVVRA